LERRWQALAKVSFNLKSMDADSCINPAREACRIDPTSTAARRILGGGYFKKGQEYWESEDWGDAFDCYKEALKCGLTPENEQFVYSMLVVVAGPDKANRLEDVIEIVREFLSNNPDDNNKRYTLGMFLIDLNRTQEALAVLTEYSRRDPDSADGNYGLAKVHVAMGNRDAATRELEILSRKAPEKAAKIRKLMR